MRKGFQPGSVRSNGIGLNMFSEDELQQVHLATLDVLWNIGVKVESDKALGIFHDGGCSIEPSKKIVKIPAWLAEDAIRSAPPTFRACGRNPEKDYVCEKDRTGFVNFGEAPQMLDLESRELRTPLKRDVDEATRLMDALEEIVVFERPLTPSDMDQDIACLYNTKAFYQHCTKHGYIGINSVDNLRSCFAMGCAVAGGEEAFRQRPTFSTTCDPISPLLHSRDACDVLIEACELGVPLKINPLGLTGGTTCVNQASALVTHNAENLSMLLLGQLVRKGHPMVYGSSTSMMDLKTGLASMGCPEGGIFSAAIAKMAQFYQLPSWTSGG